MGMGGRRSCSERVRRSRQAPVAQRGLCCNVGAETMGGGVASSPRVVSSGCLGGRRQTGRNDEESSPRVVMVCERKQDSVQAETGSRVEDGYKDFEWQSSSVSV